MLMVIAISIPFIILIKKHKDFTKNLPTLALDNIPAEGYSVPIIASFRGFKNVPLVALAYNNLSPKLIIYPDHIQFKVVFTFTKKYNEISNISIFRTIGTENIIFLFKDSKLTFSANLADRKALKTLVIFLKNKDLKTDSKTEDFINTEI